MAMFTPSFMAILCTVIENCLQLGLYNVESKRGLNDLSSVFDKSTLGGQCTGCVIQSGRKCLFSDIITNVEMLSQLSSSSLSVATFEGEFPRVGKCTTPIF